MEHLAALHGRLMNLSRYYQNPPTEEDINQTIETYKTIYHEQLKEPHYAHYGRHETGLKYFKFSANGPDKIYVRSTKKNSLFGSGSLKYAYGGLDCMSLKEVAILKCPSESYAYRARNFDPEIIKNLKSEAEYANSFPNNPRIAGFKSTGFYKGRHLGQTDCDRFEMVADRADTDIYEWLTVNFSKERPPSLALALPMMKQMSQALKSLHAQALVHRDVKIENFLISHTESGVSVSLTDFGMCCGFDKKVLRILRGTLAYLPPDAICRYNSTSILYDTLEQAQKGDIYALGLCFYMFLFRRVHFFQPEIEQMVRIENCQPLGFIGATWSSLKFAIKHLSWKKGCQKLGDTPQGDIMMLMVEMLRPRYEKRPSLEDIITRVDRIMEKIPAPNLLPSDEP